jgi:hypothetical protein
MCRLMPYFISNSQICDRINIDWVAVQISRISCQIDWVSIATWQRLIQLQIGESETKEGIKLHISRIDYVAIGWVLPYLVGARNVDYWGGGFGWEPIVMVRFRVGTRPGTDQGILTRCQHYCIVTSFKSYCTLHLYMWKGYWHTHCPILEMIINDVLKILDLLSRVL